MRLERSEHPGLWAIVDMPYAHVEISATDSLDEIEAEIVRRVNCHEELVAALRDIVLDVRRLCRSLCICHETVVGKPECPVHGPHPAVEGGAE